MISWAAMFDVHEVVETTYITRGHGIPPFPLVNTPSPFPHSHTTSGELAGEPWEVDQARTEGGGWSKVQAALQAGKETPHT